MIRLTERIVQCFADDNYGNVCGLPKGHDGPHGYERPEAEVNAAQDWRREQIKVWLPKEKN
jgi:hypothetical protein